MTKSEFDAVYRLHGAMVRRQALRILGDKAQSDDMMQEVFLRFIEYAKTKPVTHAGALLYRMATQMSVKRLRRERLIQPTDATALDLLPRNCAAEDTTVLRRLLVVMDPKCAEIGALYFINGMTYLEISELTNLDPSAVAREVARLIAKGRRLLGVNLAESEPQKVHP